MKQRVHLWLTSCLLAALTATASMMSYADEESAPKLLDATAKPALANQLVPPAPTPDVKSFVLMAADSEKVLADQNGHERLAPASLTKMMTLYIISSALKNGQIRLEDEVRISRKASQATGSKMFLKEDQRVSVKDLIMGIIVQSGNDACIAMSEYLAGSEETFVSLMNQEAQRLGMKDTHFVDCTGMPDPNHYSSAYDIALLANALATKFPEYYPWYSEKWFTFNNIRQPNRNRLLWRFQGADGIKTGHTDDAGFCLAASAKKDGMRLFAVVFGAPSDNARADATERLLTYGFRFYKTYKLYSTQDAVAQPRVWKGTDKTVVVTVAKSLYITIPDGQYNNLKPSIVLKDPLTAPITKGQEVGRITVSLGDKVLVDEPLVASEAVTEGGMWRRFSDSINMSLHSMLDKDDDVG